MTFEPRLDILPESQRRLWPELDAVPSDFVLYGGPALHSSSAIGLPKTSISSRPRVSIRTACAPGCRFSETWMRRIQPLGCTASEIIWRHSWTGAV